MDNCTIDCIESFGNFSQSATCDFVQEYCVQDTVQIIQGYYCLINSSLIVLFIFSVFVLLMVYYAMNIATDDFLAPCLQDFIVKLNMSQALAGITFLALANGAPDIITAVVAGTSSSDSTILIPFGSLYGAALFSMAFILSMVIYYSRGKELVLHVRENVVPLLFYLGGTLYLVLVSLFYGKMNIYIAVIFFSFYILYFCIVLYEEHSKKKKAKKESLLSQNQRALEDESQQEMSKMDGSKKAKKSFGEQAQQVQDEIRKQDENSDEQKKKKGLLGQTIHWIRVFWLFIFNYTIPLILTQEISNFKLILSIVLSPIVLILAEGIPGAFDKTIADIPYAAWFCFPSALLLIYMIYNIARGKTPYFTTIFNIYGFVVIVTWLALVVAVLINLMELLQLLTNINSVFLGLTVFAGAGSIGDYLSIVAFAKRGYSSTAVSGVFSGQLLNFLIGFGIATIANSISNGEYDFNIFKIDGSTYQVLSDLIVVAVIAMSFVYMVGMTVVIIVKRGKLENRERVVIRIFYFVFILVAFLISVLTDFFREFSCDM